MMRFLEIVRIKLLLNRYLCKSEILYLAEYGLGAPMLMHASDSTNSPAAFKVLYDLRNRIPFVESLASDTLLVVV